MADECADCGGHDKLWDVRAGAILADFAAGPAALQLDISLVGRRLALAVQGSTISPH